MMIVYLLLFVTDIHAYQAFFGNVHSHSTYSDGKVSDTNLPSASAEQAFSYARDIAGLDFLAVTDHNHHQAGMSLSHFQLLIDDSFASNNDENFVSLFGIEWGNIETGGHVIYYEIPKLFGWQQNLYHQYVGIKDYHGLASLIQQEIMSNSQNGFLLLAHPNPDDYEQLLESSYNQAMDEAISLIQVKNGPAYSEREDYKHASDKEYEDIFFKALSLGYHVSPTADQDNHNGNWGTTNSQRTVVWANSLTRDNILDALKNGRTYAAEDKNLVLKFSVENCIMGSSIQKIENFPLSVAIQDTDSNDQTKKIELYFGIVGSNEPAAVISSKDDSDTLSYQFNIDEYKDTPIYFLVKVTQKDYDRAWSAPIYINDRMIAQKCFDGQPGKKEDTPIIIDDDNIQTTNDDNNTKQDSDNKNVQGSTNTEKKNTEKKTQDFLEKNSGCNELALTKAHTFNSIIIILTLIVFSLIRKKHAFYSSCTITSQR